MMIERRQMLLALSAGTAVGMTQAQSSPDTADLPVETFFKRSLLTQASMNPIGTRVALCLRGDAGRRRLMVVDLASMATKTVAGFNNADVTYVHWVNDDRLLFQVENEDSARRDNRFMLVDADGGHLTRFRSGFGLVTQGPQSGEQVLLTQVQDTSEGPGFLSLTRASTRTGKDEELDVPPWSIGFLIDNEGDPIAAITAHKDVARLHWRDGKAWRVIREFERFFGEDFALCSMAPDGTVYVTARQGQDQTGLYRFDPKTNTLSDQALLLLKQFDLHPGLVFGRGKLLGAQVLADAATTYWFDDESRALQARIDAKLPRTTNLLSLPRRGTSTWVLVWAYADKQPGMALAYDQREDKLVMLGRSRPQIDPGRMSAMDYRPYAARDGRSIPAYLTLPRQAITGRALPLVVLVHGGPFIRGTSWAWEAEVQFLASRGYAVLQPEFRGSTGFGEDHFKAGWKQWGQAMQDDLVDGARWAVAQGIADPKRIAIAGASYGGYAAMMALAKHDDVFACAVNWVGVTDLDLIYGAHWSDQTAIFKRFGLPKVLGDRKADADMLKANSPINLAGRIKKPVLMAYGKLDRRVPIEHGERMRDALAPHNVQVEWVRYDDEGHGWFFLKTHVDFWTRVERFLARNLSA